MGKGSITYDEQDTLLMIEMMEKGLARMKWGSVTEEFLDDMHRQLQHLREWDVEQDLMGPDPWQ